MTKENRAIQLDADVPPVYQQLARCGNCDWSGQVALPCGRLIEEAMAHTPCPNCACGTLKKIVTKAERPVYEGEPPLRNAAGLIETPVPQPMTDAVATQLVRQAREQQLARQQDEAEQLRNAIARRSTQPPSRFATDGLRQYRVSRNNPTSRDGIIDRLSQLYGAVNLEESRRRSRHNTDVAVAGLGGGMEMTRPAAATPAPARPASSLFQSLRGFVPGIEQAPKPQ